MLLFGFGVATGWLGVVPWGSVSASAWAVVELVVNQ